MSRELPLQSVYPDGSRDQSSEEQSFGENRWHHGELQDKSRPEFKGRVFNGKRKEVIIIKNKEQDLNIGLPVDLYKGLSFEEIMAKIWNSKVYLPEILKEEAGKRATKLKKEPIEHHAGAQPT